MFIDATKSHSGEHLLPGRVGSKKSNPCTNLGHAIKYYQSWISDIGEAGLGMVLDWSRSAG